MDDQGDRPIKKERRDKKDKKEVQQEAVIEMRRLTKELAALPRDADINIIQEKLAEHIRAGDKCYVHLKKKIDGSSVDAKHMKQLCHHSASVAKRINSTSSNFNFKDKLLKIKRECGSEITRFIAQEYGSGDLCYAPTFEFFYGALNQEGLIVQPRKKRAKVIIDDRNISSIRASERNLQSDCEQDSTPKEVEAIHEKIKNSITEDRYGVDFLRVVLDPDSYTKTVENLFHFAFLVKDGNVRMKKGRNGKPVITPMVESESKQWNQSVLSFSMADYKSWIQSRYPNL